MRRGARGAGRRGGRRAARRTYRRRRRRRRRRIVVGGMIIAGVGYGAYKLTQPQADQIEQHTGKKLEDLDETQMEQAMNDLGIEAEEPTEAEMAQLDAGEAPAESAPAQAQPSQPAAAPASTAPPAAASSDPSYLDELEKLAELHQQGILNDEEFEAKKKQLLGL